MEKMIKKTITGAPWGYGSKSTCIEIYFSYFLKSKYVPTQNQKWRMIIRDNLTRFSVDQEMSKLPKFDCTRIAMPSSLLLSPEGFGVEPY